MITVSVLIFIFIVDHLSLFTIGQTCTALNNIDHVVRGTYINSTYWYSTTTPGTLTCATECLYRTNCRSFNFNTDSGRCVLFNFNSSSTEYIPLADPSYIFSDIGHWIQNLVDACADHICPENSICEVVDGIRNCSIEGCTLPSVAHGITDGQGPVLRPFGDIVNYTCGFGYDGQGQAECLDTGNWTTVRCRPMPGSCAEVQQCDGDVTDGHYWIYLNNFNDERVRVFCHGMNTSQPEEYITLLHPNSGVYPPTFRRDCGIEKYIEIYMIAPPLKEIGSTEYDKIQINVQNLKVNLTSKTFASGTAVKLHDYATSADCYVNYIPSRSCTSKGNFTVDLRDTGFQLDAEQTWVTFGWMPFMNVTWLDPASVYLNCGGFCGRCYPVDGLLLVPSPGHTPVNNTAKTSSCDAGV